MITKSFTCLALLLTVVWPLADAAAEGPLTLARVIELAASAPEVRLAATQVAEEEARLAGARVRTLDDPVLELAAGPRSGGEESDLDAEAALEFPIELWGRRGKRIAVAEAGLQRERHAAEEVRRQSVNAAIEAWYRLLHAGERLQVAGERKALAEELRRIAEERHTAGEVARFEVNLAATETARAESDIAAEKGRVARAQAALAQSLGLPSGAALQVGGDIRDRRFFEPLSAAEPVAERPDLLVARAEIEAAQAGVALAEAERRPDLALRLSYSREGEENVALAGVSVGLPFLNPRRGTVEEARAKQQRAEIAADTRRAAIASHIEGARRAYAAAVEAVGRMENEALPLQQENEGLAAESYRAGKIDLATLLQVRREAFETRREYLDRLLEAAEAGVALASAVGTSAFPSPRPLPPGEGEDQRLK